MANLKNAACDEIDSAKSDLHAISQDIWEHPEENYEEVYCHAAISDFLEKQGFVVDRHYVVDTGFRSIIGSNTDGPHIAVICEYDALPEVGHACGHNLIAEVGLAAGIGIKAAFEANGKPLGKLTVLGTPAEEGGGGKIHMVNAHVFDDVDAAIMAHPSPFNRAAFKSLAVDRVVVKYHGKASHPSAFPWDGINALDAAVLCYQNVSCMRQQCKPDWRIHGVICHGGVKPNIIPDFTELEFCARTPTKNELFTLKQKLEGCFNSAAIATGCTLETEWMKTPYYDMINNSVMSSLYRDNAVTTGVDFVNHGPREETFSTDMGNVSYVVPSIHPMFYVGSNAVNHTREFAGAAGDEKAQPYTLAVAKAIAMTAIDIYTSPDKLTALEEEFKKSKEKNM